MVWDSKYGFLVFPRGFLFFLVFLFFWIYIWYQKTPQKKLGKKWFALQSQSKNDVFPWFFCSCYFVDFFLRKHVFPKFLCFLTLFVTKTIFSVVFWVFWYHKLKNKEKQKTLENKTTLKKNIRRISNQRFCLERWFFCFWFQSLTCVTLRTFVFSFRMLAKWNDCPSAQWCTHGLIAAQTACQTYWKWKRLKWCSRISYALWRTRGGPQKLWGVRVTISRICEGVWGAIKAETSARSWRYRRGARAHSANTHSTPDRWSTAMVVMARWLFLHATHPPCRLVALGLKLKLKKHKVTKTWNHWHPFATWKRWKSAQSLSQICPKIIFKFELHIFHWRRGRASFLATKRSRAFGRCASDFVSKDRRSDREIWVPAFATTCFPSGSLSL